MTTRSTGDQHDARVRTSDMCEVKRRIAGDNWVLWQRFQGMDSIINREMLISLFDVTSTFRVLEISKWK